MLTYHKHSFPQHAHDFGELFVGEGERRNLVHLSSGRAPRVVVGGLADLGFGLGVVHHQFGGLVDHLTDFPQVYHLVVGSIRIRNTDVFLFDEQSPFKLLL